MRSSVGPNFQHEIRNRPSAWVASAISIVRQIVGEQERRGRQEADVPAGEESPDQQQDADGIEHVVDVEAVARPLVLPDPGERAVEAVAEPVHHQEEDHEEQGRPPGGASA